MFLFDSSNFEFHTKSLFALTLSAADPRIATADLIIHSIRIHSVCM
jgi:hypothetical protein